MKTSPESTLAVVTGSTSGIGKAIARSLADKGLTVILNGRRDISEISEFMDELRKSSGDKNICHYVRGDVADDITHMAIHEKIHQLGGELKVLVNNAGMSTKDRKDVLELERDDVTRLFDVNLTGPFMLTRLLSHELMNHESTSYIINISSLSAYTVSTNRADYCISKAGLSMMTQVFASRLAGENVAVFEIRPGIIRTGMTEGVMGRYEQLVDEGLLPIPRIGEPGDIARTVMGIVEGYHPYATGSVLNVDGGFHIRRL
ncbi:MAG: 3-ketoacyl-ACP reductase [Spirochaetota bacterium]